MPDGPPPYLRFMRMRRPSLADIDASTIFPMSLETETIMLHCHRLGGLSTPLGYWSDTWQDSWAIEELLKWEGREDEIRRDKYYADFIVDENQQARENERRQIESESVRSASRPMVLVVHESVRESRVDSGPNVLGRAESDSYLRLERGVSGGHAADLSGKDDA